MSVNFILNSLSSSVQLSQQGTISTEAPTALDVSATAVFYAKTSDLKNVFQFQTDAINIDDLSSNDMKFYVNMTSWPEYLVLNPANAMLDQPSSANAIASVNSGGSPYAANKMLVKHDFVRYLALQLFNTYHGADIFNNQSEIVSDIETKCGGGAEGASWFDISAALHNVDSQVGTSPYLLTDASGRKFMTIADTSSDNLCRELFDQIANYSTERLAGIAGSPLEQSVPLMDGDSINFKLTVAPAEGQEEVVPGTSVIGTRSYAIKLILVSDANFGSTYVNTEP
jgi:hypothetical protein